MFCLPELDADDMTRLADVADCSTDELRAELRRRPWMLADLLTQREATAAVLDGSDLDNTPSPYLFFAATAYQAASDLADATHVNDWIGPKQRIPVFDVEPLQEFARDPSRVLFVAAVLTHFVRPTASVPGDSLDLNDLVQWLEQVLPQDRGDLLVHLGHVALFQAGVYPDQTGNVMLEPQHAHSLGESAGMDPEEILELLDPAQPACGLQALETLGARWYEAAAAEPDTRTPLLSDVAARFSAARRFVTHVADSYLNQGPTLVPGT